MDSNELSNMSDEDDGWDDATEEAIERTVKDLTADYSLNSSECIHCCMKKQTWQLFII